jgi:hypothetical protein
MNERECEATFVELESLIFATPSPLCESIGRELAFYTIPFVAVHDGMMGTGAGGTLVSFDNEHYILTAAHVWSVLRKSDMIRIPLKEGAATRFEISPKEIVPCLLWGGWENQWGPDLAMLRIRSERAGTFKAYGRSFFPLSKKRAPKFNCGILIWFLVGAPAVRGFFSREKSIPELQAMQVLVSKYPFSAILTSQDARDRFDFLDVLIDTSQPDVAPTFVGVSGGGFWGVYVFKDNETGKICNFKVLDGVAFWQIPDEPAKRLTMRCHGPQSIGEAVRWMHSGISDSFAGDEQSGNSARK